MAKREAAGDVSVAEMARLVDAKPADANSIHGFPEAIYAGVEAGESTESTLVDMVTLRSGIYIPDIAKRYRKAEQRIADGVGEIALVVVKRSEEAQGRPHKVWSLQSSRTKLYAGRIIAPDPIIDASRGQWALPTKRYTTQLRGQTKADAQTGPMPVDDLLLRPASPGLNSTLDQELHTEPIKFGHENTDSPRGSIAVIHRMLKHTVLYVGVEEITKAGYQGVLQP
jgi:hypothetical protein